MANRAKKLLIVTQHFWPEAFRINDMVEGFLADGIAVDVLCGLPNYPKGEWFDGYTAKGPMQEDYHGATVYRCREIPRKGNTSVRIFLNYISFPITASLALHRLSGGYDAVLCYNTSPVLMSFPAILAARKFHVPLTNYVLDIWPENLYSVLNIQNKALRKIATVVSDWHYRQADKLIAMSDGLERRLRARVGEKNARGCVGKIKQYTVIPQYCEDFYDVAQWTRNTNRVCDETQSNSFTIVFAGNFSPAQSLETALHAIAQCKADRLSSHTATCPNIHLKLVGDGMSRATLEQLRITLELTDCVQFVGSVRPEEVPAIAQTADALLVTLSDSADVGLTIPAKLASCMAAGKPLLVAINGEGARVASESGGALVSVAADVNALAMQMQKLATMPTAQRQAMGELAHAYYKAHFDRTTLLKQIESFIF